MSNRFPPRTALLAVPLLLATLAVLSPSAGADEMKATARGDVRSASQSENLPVMPPRESAILSPERPEDFQADVNLVDPHFGTVRIAGKEIRVVLGASSKETAGPDIAWIDLDADGRLSDSEKIEVTPEKNEDRGTVNATKSDLHLRIDGKDIAFSFSYMSFPGRGVYASLAMEKYLEAKVTLGGEDYRVAVVDSDSDGAFDGEKDLWTIVKADASIERPESPWALSGLGEQRVLGDRRFAIAVKGDNEMVVTAVASSEPRPEDLASHRDRVEHMWFDRFDGERDGFIEARGIDTSRPKTDDPIPWHFVSFDQGLEMAKKEGKLLFVDVLAFWCVWCYRMDYYTYPDAEVAQLLEQSFVPVKVVQEQDAAGDYSTLMEKLGARGIPAMGVWTPDGELVRYVSGWKTPADFVAELRAALEEASKDEG
jgi:hypothetical protein